MNNELSSSPHPLLLWLFIVCLDTQNLGIPAILTFIVAMKVVVGDQDLEDADKHAPKKFHFT